MAELWRHYRNIRVPRLSHSSRPREPLLHDGAQHPLLAAPVEKVQPTLPQYPTCNSIWMVTLPLLWAVSSRCGLCLPNSPELDILGQRPFCFQTLVEQQEVHTITKTSPFWGQSLTLAISLCSPVWAKYRAADQGPSWIHWVAWQVHWCPTEGETGQMGWILSLPPSPLAHCMAGRACLAGAWREQPELVSLHNQPLLAVRLLASVCLCVFVFFYMCCCCSLPPLIPPSFYSPQVPSSRHPSSGQELEKPLSGARPLSHPTRCLPSPSPPLTPVGDLAGQQYGS
jgi:hypothetical protein